MIIIYNEHALFILVIIFRILDGGTLLPDFV